MKLLLAEDTQDLNKAVTTVLQYQGYKVDSAFDGQEALDFIEHDSYDGIILDIMMPKVDGIEVLKQIRSKHILTPVLLLTAKSEIDDRVAGLDAGADDYLPKPFAMKELLARIRSMTRRHQYDNETNLSFKDVTLEADSYALHAESSIRLSNKEYDLMRALLLNPNGLDTSSILTHVWNNEPGAQEDTVHLYISYLKRKLKSVGSKVSIIHIGNKYIVEETNG